MHQIELFFPQMYHHCDVSITALQLILGQWSQGIIPSFCVITPCHPNIWRHQGHTAQFPPNIPWGPHQGCSTCSIKAHNHCDVHRARPHSSHHQIYSSAIKPSPWPLLRITRRFYALSSAAVSCQSSPTNHGAWIFFCLAARQCQQPIDQSFFGYCQLRCLIEVTSFICLPVDCDAQSIYPNADQFKDCHHAIPIVRLPTDRGV